MKQLFALILLVFAFGMTLTSCKKDHDDVFNPPRPVNDEEIITTVQLNFTDVTGNQNPFSVIFRDPDGVGGDEPVRFDTIRLQSNSTYEVQILLLNETEQLAENLSEEVLEEGDEHLLCYTVSQADLTITRTDSDGQFEIGLSTEWVTQNPGSGSVKIALKHQPGEKDGTCEPGGTDMELEFVTIIQ